MAQLHISHPDILEFIEVKSTIKDKDNPLSNFNISVQIPDSFIHVLGVDGMWPLINPRTGEIVKEVSAKSLWNTLCYSAWLSGDPGCVFIDRVHEAAPNPTFGPIESSNPCVAKGTLVLTPNGWTPVERLPVGSTITTPDGEHRTIDSVEFHPGCPVFLILFTSTDPEVYNRGVRATASHQFSTPDGFRRLDSLSIGDSVLALGDGEIVTVTVMSIEPHGRTDVYDLHEPLTDTWVTEGIISRGCGEEFLEPYGSCNLGSINLAHAVFDGSIDWDRLRDTVVLAVRFLDNVITVNRFPDSVPQIRKVNLLTRRIGLGVMGWADMLDQLGTSYDSDEAIQLAKGLSGFITRSAWQASEELATEKGEFPLWADSTRRRDYPIPVRNSSVTTIAPTGTISIIAGCSSSIEPHYSLVWTRKALWNRNNNGTEQGALSLLECPQYIRSEIQRLGLDEEEVLGKAMAVPDPLLILSSYGIDCAHLRTAMEISPAAHVKMLAAWQSSVTNSVSKTINLPSDATTDDIGSAFQLAWNLNCKSVTVYRDGSKQIQVLNHLNCEECGGETRYEGGCRTCVSCGSGSCDTSYGG